MKTKNNNKNKKDRKEKKVFFFRKDCLIKCLLWVQDNLGGSAECCSPLSGDTTSTTVLQEQHFLVCSPLKQNLFVNKFFVVIFVGRAVRWLSFLTTQQVLSCFCSLNVSEAIFQRSIFYRHISTYGVFFARFCLAENEL